MICSAEKCLQLTFYGSIVCPACLCLTAVVYCISENWFPVVTKMNIRKKGMNLVEMMLFVML